VLSSQFICPEVLITFSTNGTDPCKNGELFFGFVLTVFEIFAPKFGTCEFAPWNTYIHHTYILSLSNNVGFFKNIGFF